MDGSHTIHSMRSNNGQVGHVDPLLRVLFHEGHPLHPIKVPRPAPHHLLQQPAQERSSQHKKGVLLSLTLGTSNQGTCPASTRSELSDQELPYRAPVTNSLAVQQTPTNWLAY